MSEPILSRLWLPLTRAQVLLTSGLVAFITLLCGLALDLFLIHQERFRPLTAATVLDTAFALGVGLLVFKLLSHDMEQHTRVLQRLETIDEMNHHIRNALQVIAFNAHGTSSERELREIDSAVVRIQWALREILPRVEPQFTSFESSAKEPQIDEAHGSSAGQGGSSLK